MKPRPSWQKKRRLGHALPKLDHRVAPKHGPSHKMILCLWTAGGQEVTRITAYGAVETAPPFCVHDGSRYEKMDPATRAGYAHIVHYQTRVIAHRVAS
jgi:hypothetical protein